MQSRKQVNVLITGVGGNRAIFIWKALAKSTLPIRIIGSDSSYMSSGLYRADKGYIVPKASDEAYLPRMKEIITAENIDIILIGTNEELAPLSDNAEQIKSDTGAYVVVHPRGSYEIANDKWKLANFLEQNDFAFPRSVVPENDGDLKCFLEEVRFPYIVKERLCSGSRGLHVARDNDDLEKALLDVDCPIVQEYLLPDDEEYTVGCFCDMNGKAAGSIVMRRRLAFGVTNKAQVVKHRAISDYCEAVAEKIGFRGPVNLQLRLTSNGPVIFEINPRFSSTESARAFYNYNMPEMCIRNFVLGEEVTPPETTDGYFFRHMEDVFIDTKDVESMSKNGLSKKKSGSIVSNF